MRALLAFFLDKVSRLFARPPRESSGAQLDVPTNALALRSFLLNAAGRAKMSKKGLIVATVVAGVWSMSGNRALAQDPSDTDINLFRKDVRSLKKQIVAANMNLTDDEAQQFWPIYDRYTAELVGLYDGKFALLKEYARNYTTISDEQAESYVKGRAAVEDSIMQLRLKYFPVFRKVLSGKATALFFQIDWRLALILDLQLASQTPLIEP